jgi:hypothetical protein
MFRFSLILTFMTLFIACNFKNQDSYLPATIEDSTKIQILQVSDVKLSPSKRIQFSESNAIDTLIKYANQKLPFRGIDGVYQDYSIFIDRFNRKSLIGIITFYDGEHSPPHFDFEFDNSLKRENFVKKNIPNTHSSHPFLSLLDVNNDGYKDLRDHFDKYQGATFLFNPKTKNFESNEFYYGDNVIYDKKLGCVCMASSGSAGNPWVTEYRYKIVGDSLELFESLKSDDESLMNDRYTINGVLYGYYSISQHRIIHGKEVLIDSFYGKEKHLPKKFRYFLNYDRYSNNK